MRRVPGFLLLLLSFVSNASAQSPDSLIHYETHSIELKPASPKNAHGSYYECITKKMEYGEQLFIASHSDAYATAVEIRFPDGKTKLFYDSIASIKSNSDCHFSIPIREPGIYELRFTSAKPGMKGISAVTIASCNRRAIKIDPLWTTCQKLDYVLALSHTNFDMLPTTPVRDAPDAGFTPCCNFLNESRGMLYGMKNPDGPKMYKVVYLEKLSLGTAKTLIKDLDQQLRKCMDSSWKIDDTEKDAHTPEEISYVQSGNYAYEFNPVHLQNHCQNRIRLQILKMNATTDLYSIEVIID